VAPIVGALALEWGTGRGLAALRADLARHAEREVPRLALACAGALVTPSIPLIGVVGMQSKPVAALAVAVLACVVVFVRHDSAPERSNPRSTPTVVQSEVSLETSADASNVTAPARILDERKSVAVEHPSDAASVSVSTTATLAVRVVDKLGVGVPRAYVTLQPTPAEIEAARRPSNDGVSLGSPLLGASSDASGWLTLEVPAGRALELSYSVPIPRSRPPPTSVRGSRL